MSYGEREARRSYHPGQAQTRFGTRCSHRQWHHLRIAWRPDSADRHQGQRGWCVRQDHTNRSGSLVCGASLCPLRIEIHMVGRHCASSCFGRAEGSKPIWTKRRLSRRIARGVEGHYAAGVADAALTRERWVRVRRENAIFLACWRDHVSPGRGKFQPAGYPQGLELHLSHRTEERTGHAFAAGGSCDRRSSRRSTMGKAQRRRYLS